MNKEEQSRIGKSNVARGKSHERNVANYLTEWSNYKFVRRKVEGTNESVTRRNSAADVICASHQFKFSVEVKCGAGFSYEALLTNPGGNKFSNWWAQCVHDAGITSTAFSQEIHPMLFFKPTPSTNWVAITKESLNCLNVVNELQFLEYKYPKTEYSFDVSHSPKHAVMASFVFKDIIMMPRKQFAAAVAPDSTLFFDL